MDEHGGRWKSLETVQRVRPRKLQIRFWSRPTPFQRGEEELRTGASSYPSAGKRFFFNDGGRILVE